VHAEDMEFGKYRRKIMRKFHIDNSKYIEDLETLNDVPGPFWDACSGQFKISADNKPSIRKWNSLEKKYDFYCSNSKHYTLVDPNVSNPQSIQYESNFKVKKIKNN